MACGKAARTLPGRRGPRSTSRTARLATPVATSGGFVSSRAAEGRLTRAPVTSAPVSAARDAVRPDWLTGSMRYGGYRAVVTLTTICRLKTNKPICDTQDELINLRVRGADGAAWEAGARQPRRLNKP